MIPTLGKGMLFEVTRNKERWLTEAERRRAVMLFAGLFACITLLIYIWILL
jgi:hypothetical protein